LRQNKDGNVYGITYVDHRDKCVFNGSDLGKQYSAKAIEERCGQNVPTNQKPGLQSSEILQPAPQQSHKKFDQTLNQKINIEPTSMNRQAEANQPLLSAAAAVVINSLTQPENRFEYVPSQLKKKARKRKKKRIS